MVKQTLLVKSWNSELQHFSVSGNISWGSNFRLKGTPAKGCDVTDCTIGFYYGDRKQLPDYNETEKKIEFTLPYEAYQSVLQFLQTCTQIEINYTLADSGDITAMIYNGSTMIKA
jgi:hypothetical protein